MSQQLKKNSGKFIISIILFIPIFIQAQDNSVNTTPSPILVTNHIVKEQPIIIVKWITNQLIYPQGVDVYKQKMGDLDWIKLTPTPLVKGAYNPTTEEYSRDSTLIDYIDMADKITMSDLSGFVKAYVLIKSVQSNPFAQFIGIQYVDTEVQHGDTYRYKVVAINSDKGELIGHSEFIRVEDFTPQSPPSGIEITPHDKKVFINWLPEDLRFHGVNIYRSSSKDTIPRRINSVPLMISKRELPNGEEKYPEIFFTDDSLENRIKYTYHLTGIDFFGRETMTSDKVTVMPGDKKAPLAPYNLRLKVDKYNINLNWINRTTTDQEGINIYRSYKNDNRYQKVNNELLPLSETSYIDRDLAPGFYYYLIAAIDSAGNEGRSAKMLAQVHDITPPAAPQNITAIADTGRIVISWDENTETDLLGYQVYRTVTANKKDFFVLLNADPFTANTYTDLLPSNSKNYFLYKVVALDSSLNKSDYSEMVQAKMPDITPPVQPVIIGATPKESAIQVEWVANCEPDLMGYELYRFTDSLNNKNKLNSTLIAPSVKRYTDQFVSTDTLYYYSLQAVDSTGNKSELSVPYAGVLTLTRADDPTSTIKKFTIRKAIFSKTLKLQWATDKANSFIGYTIFRRIGPNDEPQKISDLLTNNSFTVSSKNQPRAQYQLRIYHSTGQVVKSEWVSQ